MTGADFPIGITDLPPGTIAAIVTHLERREPPGDAALAGIDVPGEGAAGPRFERIAGDPAGIARYRRLFRAIGIPWLWFSRAGLDDPALRAILADPGVEACALASADGDLGLVEVDVRAPDEAEIAFLGLVPGREGCGLGARLMGRALACAFARPIRRLTVHTCTLDHPSALAFYARHGFRAVRRSVEVVPDPRLAGALPHHAGPHHPIIA